MRKLKRKSLSIPLIFIGLSQLLQSLLFHLFVFSLPLPLSLCGRTWFTEVEEAQIDLRKSGFGLNSTFFSSSIYVRRIRIGRAQRANSSCVTVASAAGLRKQSG